MNFFGKGKTGSRASGRSSKGKGTELVPAIKVNLDRATNLPSADSNGFSDPYCVFRSGGFRHKTKYRKKTLNPIWGFEFYLEDSDIVYVEVFDYDFMSKDDFLGRTEVSTADLRQGKPKEFAVPLYNDDGEEAGELFFTLTRTMVPVSFLEAKRTQRQAMRYHGNRRVVVELIEGRELVASDYGTSSDPFVKLSIGREKRRSKAKHRTLNPQWKERFEFPLEEAEEGEPGEHVLEVEVWDKDTFSKNDLLGTLTIDLDDLEIAIVNSGWFPLTLDGIPPEKAGYLFMLITVMELGADSQLSDRVKAKYAGSVKVHIAAARNLRSADRNGKSDPYVEISCGNARLRTSVVEKTLNPTWDVVMELPVTDIFSVLKVSVWDDDRGQKPDFLGALEIQLLDIQNGQLEWYALKDETLLKRSKGDLQLAMDLQYEPFKAYLKVIGRREEDYMAKLPKFSSKVTLSHINRIKALGARLMQGITILNGLFGWKYGPMPSAVAMVVMSICLLIFRLWMVPLGLLGYLLYTRETDFRGREFEIDENGFVKSPYEEEYDSDEELEKEEDEAERGGSFFDLDPTEEEEADDKEEKRVRRGFFGQYAALKKHLKTGQDVLGFLAQLGERFKNIANWIVPKLTEIICYACFLGTIATIFLPLNVILILIILRRFQKLGFRKYVPGFQRSKFHKPIFEPVELIGRVPSDLDKIKRRRFQPYGNDQILISTKLTS